MLDYSFPSDSPYGARVLQMTRRPRKLALKLGSLILLMLFAWVPVLAIALLCRAAFGAELAASLPTDTLDFVGTIAAAFRGKDYELVASLVISLSLALVNKFDLLQRLPTKAMPWISAGLGVLAGLATNFAAHMPWSTAIVAGLTSGVGAVGLWEMVLKHLMPTASPSAIGGVVPGAAPAAPK